MHATCSSLTACTDAKNDLVDALEAIVTLALLSGMDTVEKLQCESHEQLPIGTTAAEN